MSPSRRKAVVHPKVGSSRAIGIVRSSIASHTGSTRSKIIFCEPDHIATRDDINFGNPMSCPMRYLPLAAFALVSLSGKGPGLGLRRGLQGGLRGRLPVGAI